MNPQELYDHLLNASYGECLAIKRNAGARSPYVTDQRLADLLQDKLDKFARYWAEPTQKDY